MATRVTSTHLVGRAHELAELQAALREAADGNPSLAFIAGESGVGKSRLLSEFEHRARGDEGAVVIGGDAVDLGEGELPYAPLVAALRPLARTGDPVLDELSPATRGELATLMPELPGRGDTPPPTAVADDERGSAQRRLFEALLTLLERLGQRGPVVLSLEDVHWADRSTRAFLVFLARSLCKEPVLVVLTYRSDEMHRRHPLRPLLAELERAPRARRLDLDRFDRTELAEQLEDILGAPPAPDLVDRLLERSEGNPLFAEELLASGLDGRGGLPPTLRDALMVRVERLSEAAQEALRVLAAGRRLDHGLLADATGMEPRELRDALREAVAGHIAVVDEEGWHTFRHALLREVVVDDLLPGERSALHLALAHAFERRADDGPKGAWVAARIAEHYRAAGDQPAELAAAIGAAEQADRVRAYGEAAALLDRVLELWDRVPDAEAHAGVQRVELLLRAARDHYRASDDARAVTLMELALEELDPKTEPRRVAVVLGDLAAMRWTLGRGEAARDTLAEALELLPEDEPSRERAKLLVDQVRFFMLQGRYSQTREAAQAALAAIEAAGADDLYAPVLNRLGIALICDGQPELGTKTLRDALELARKSGVQDAMAVTYANLADGLHAIGRSTEALEVAVEGLAEMEDPRARTTRWLAAQAGSIAFDLGDWHQAEERIVRPAPAAGIHRVNALNREAELALGRGDHERARQLLDEVSRLIATTLEPQFIGGVGAMQAQLERREGNLETAREIVEEALDRLEFCTDDVRFLAQVAGVGVTVEADAAERARDLGDDAQRDEALERLEPMLLRVEAAATDGRPIEAAHLLTANAELTRAQGEPDPEAWAAAAQAWADALRPYPEAQARWREAEAYVAAGDREAAAVAAGLGLRTARALGSAWLIAELEGLAARARLRIDGDEERPEDGVGGSSSADEPFGLTPRERQVLALVARGATNREIGAELYMAEKTASVHVSRILAKLEVRTRTEAAAVAHRHGLADLVPS
jgi:DNA-binding CsgD family transcriptional regulator/tetratricopeptide (TPR) repeat protein